MENADGPGLSLLVQGGSPDGRPLEDAAKDDDEEEQDCDCSLFKSMSLIIGYIVVALFYIIDIGTDLWAASMYLFANEIRRCALTFAIVVLSVVVLNVINIYWYYRDYRGDKADNRREPYPVKWMWPLRIVMTVCFLGPVARCIEISWYGYRARRTKQSEIRQYYENLQQLAIHDSSVLGLIESFVESAPQLCLQLYIMQTQGTEKENFRLFIQAASCSTSWCSCAWSLVSYTRANREIEDLQKKSQGQKEGIGETLIPMKAVPLLLSWRLFTIGPRILALALFASIASIRFYMLAAVACHWFLMTAWLVSSWAIESVRTGSFRKTYCDSAVTQVLFDMIVGFIYIFAFLNIRDGHTRKRYAAFYILVYLENIGMGITWFKLTFHAGFWYFYPAFLFVIIGYPMGVGLMLIYYRCCHHRQIENCLNRRRVSNAEQLEVSEEMERRGESNGGVVG